MSGKTFEQPLADRRSARRTAARDEIVDAAWALAREQGLAGTPVIVRSDGAVIEGFRPREVLEQWLKGARS